MNKNINHNFFNISQNDINQRIHKNSHKRKRREIQFQTLALTSIFTALAILLLLLITTAWQAKSALWQSEILIPVQLSPDTLDINGNSPQNLQKANYGGAIKAALRKHFPHISARKEKKQLYKIISDNAAFELRRKLIADPTLFQSETQIWLLASAHTDAFLKGKNTTQISAKQTEIIRTLQTQSRTRTQFNTRFFTNGDSRNAEAAGIAAALIGSAWMILVTIVLAAPIGIMAAIYLQEFAPKNRFYGFIEININTLAAVPSIIFGLLGLAAFIEFFGAPRSAPITGGMVLALMTLPTIIIATRSGLQTVPPSIREGTLAMGASRMQTVLHHVLPFSLPSILTGCIIGIAQAIGETAPLLMIGMVAFIIDLPTTATDPAAALPVQIFIWADHPEKAFAEKTALAILVLLVFIAIINSAATILRQKFTPKW